MMNVSAEARKRGSSEARKRGSEKARSWKSGSKRILLLTSSFLLLTCIWGCAGLQEARDIKAAPMPPKYYAGPPEAPAYPEGSLWRDSGHLYEDRKARRVNDLVTILISERTQATKKATTNADRDSNADYAIEDLFGADLSFKIHNLPVIKDYYSAGRRFSPTLKGNAKSEFAGKGDTAREGRLVATITAKVVEVMPNSNMVIESRKEVLVNNEKEIIVLRGIVRPDDVSTNNTVASQFVADAQIYLVGDGVLDDKQSQGWLVRFFDKTWPF